VQSLVQLLRESGGAVPAELQDTELGQSLMQLLRHFEHAHAGKVTKKQLLKLGNETTEEEEEEEEEIDEEEEDLEARFQGEEGELEEGALAQFVVVPLGLAVIASLFLGSWLEHHHIGWFPESLMTTCLGMLLGVYMKATIGDNEVFETNTFNETMGTLLMLFLLPILMFDAGWSLRKKDFASQFEYVMAYAVGGSLISFIVVGLLIYSTGAAGLHSITTLRTAFGYASLVCATDPVSTLATFSHRQVDPLLNILTFGDSVFNDAVAIILFKVLNSDTIMGTPDSRPALSELTVQIFWGIGKIFVGSVCIGVFMAFFFLFCLRVFDMQHNPKVEILALTTIAYATFGLGEVVEMSGIISTVFCSIILGIYARVHLSDSGLLMSNFFVKELATFMDTTVFLLVGFCVVHMGTKDSSGWIFGMWTMLFCLIGRACAVIPVTKFSNFVKRKIGEAKGQPEEDWHLISNGIMYMMWHAGLRGAIALTLCMEFGEWVDVLNGPGTRRTLQTATYLMIVVFLLIFGGTTDNVLAYWGIPMGDESSPDKLYRSELPGPLHDVFAFMDEKIMQPLFIGEEKQQAHERQITNLDKEDDAQVALKKVKSFKRYSVIQD